MSRRVGMRRNERTPVIDRLLEKCVEDELFGCWRFTGCIMPAGYGQVRGDEGTVLTHRYTYNWFRGDIPDGLVLDHLCRNRDCCNPWHVEPVPQSVNLKRGVGPLSAGWQLAEENRAKTHCPRGHEYNTENTYVVPATGHRQCIPCKRLRNQRKAA